MKKSDLKHCPFCGGMANYAAGFYKTESCDEITFWQEDEPVPDCDFYLAGCMACEVTVKPEIWNKRICI